MNPRWLNCALQRCTAKQFHFTVNLSCPQMVTTFLSDFTSIHCILSSLHITLPLFSPLPSPYLTLHNTILLISTMLIFLMEITGTGDGLTGKRGADVYIRVPLGTVVTERLSDNLQDFIVRRIWTHHFDLYTSKNYLIAANIYLI